MRKKTLIYILVATLVLVPVSTCYFSGLMPESKAHAVALVDDAAVLLAILIATGIVYVGSTLWRENLDGTVDIDFPWEIDDVLGNQWDDLQEEYWREHNEATGGSGDGSDFDPNNDDPNEKPPKWDKLKEYVKSHGGVAFAAGGALGTLAASFAKKVHDLITIEDAQVSPIKVDAYPNLYIGYSTCGATNPTFLSDYYDCILDGSYLACGTTVSNTNTYVALSRKPLNNLSNDAIILQYLSGVSLLMSYAKSSVSYTYGAQYKFDGIGRFYEFGNRAFCGSLDRPFYVSPDVDIYLGSVDVNGHYVDMHPLDVVTDYITADNTLTSSDLSDYIANNPDASSLPVADKVRVPTEQELKDFYAKYTQTQDQQAAIDELIKKLTSTGTDPTPDESGGESGGTGGGTDPGESESTSTDVDLDPYKPGVDIKLVFPFCIPFDLIHAFGLLQSSPQAPVFEIPLKIDFGSIHIDEHWEIDFADFEFVVAIFRLMETLGFCVGLILITRGIIKG